MAGKFFEVLSIEIFWEADWETFFFNCRARVKVRVNGRIRIGDATSTDGQINAFDKALRGVLEEFYPEIKKVELVDYRVSLPEKEKGTGAYVRIYTAFLAEGKKFEAEAEGSDLVATSIDSIVSCYQDALEWLRNKSVA